MVRIEFLGPIQKPAIEMEAATLAEVAEALQADETLKAWLKNSAVAVNDTLVSGLDIALKDGDRISLLPPVCGG